MIDAVLAQTVTQGSRVRQPRALGRNPFGVVLRTFLGLGKEMVWKPVCLNTSPPSRPGLITPTVTFVATD